MSDFKGRPEVPAPTPDRVMEPYKAEVVKTTPIGNQPGPGPSQRGTALEAHCDSLTRLIARMDQAEDTLLSTLHRLRGASDKTHKGGPLPQDPILSTMKRLETQAVRLNEISDHINTMADELADLV
jgi:hypothetical protein